MGGSSRLELAASRTGDDDSVSARARWKPRCSRFTVSVGDLVKEKHGGREGIVVRRVSRSNGVRSAPQVCVRFDGVAGRPQATYKGGALKRIGKANAYSIGEQVIFNDRVGDYVGFSSYAQSTYYIHGFAASARYLREQLNGEVMEIVDVREGGAMIAVKIGWTEYWISAQIMLRAKPNVLSVRRLELDETWDLLQFTTVGGDLVASVRCDSWMQRGQSWLDDIARMTDVPLRGLVLIMPDGQHCLIRPHAYPECMIESLAEYFSIAARPPPPPTLVFVRPTKRRGMSSRFACAADCCQPQAA